MKLSKAAHFFDKTTFKDGYSGATLFKGRLLPFEDSTRDSTSVDRRLLSVTETAGIPEHRILDASGTRYIVGDGTDDLHGNEVLRRKYVLHTASELAIVRNFPELLGLAVGTKAYWGARMWVKGNREQDESSGIYDGYQLFFAQNEPVRNAEWGSGSFFDGYEDNLLIQMGDRWHIIRTSFQSMGGFQVVVADELPEPVLTQVHLKSRVYQPKAGTYAETTVSVAAINIRWQSSFAYRTKQSIPYEPGDAQVVIAKGSLTPKAGDIVTVVERTFKVVSVFDQLAEGCWRLHLRHA